MKGPDAYGLREMSGAHEGDCGDTTTMTPISDLIAEYERAHTDHRSGTIDIEVLRAIERLIPLPLTSTLETGCGKSTILFSRLSREHLVFTVDDSEFEESSLSYFRRCPHFDAASTRLVLGPTQQTLREFQFTTQIDAAFLDGPHGYPFPELEYCVVYPQLREGAWLIIDDIHIPTVHRLFEFLEEEEMFELTQVVRTTAIFRRTAAPLFSPVSDGWWLQRYNASRFPVNVDAPAKPTDAATPAAADRSEVERLRASVTWLESDVGALQAQVAWWQHVAEERRLKRRLQRGLGRLGLGALRRD